MHLKVFHCKVYEVKLLYIVVLSFFFFLSNIIVLCCSLWLGCHKIEVKLLVETAWLIFILFYLFFVNLSCGIGFLLFCVVSSINGWFVHEQYLCWDFFVKFVGLSDDFTKEREIKRKERLWLLQRCVNVFGIEREMGR